MILLEAMAQDDYLVWRKNAVSEYANEKLKAGNVSTEEALDTAEKEYRNYLPEGMSTKENYFYNIVDSDTGQNVGTLWIQTRNNRQEVFICDIKINERFRGKGYGKQTMNALDGLVKEMGIHKISLHVFGHNEAAINLYRTSGFKATNVLMSKVLSE